MQKLCIQICVASTSSNFNENIWLKNDSQNINNALTMFFFEKEKSR